MNEKPTEKSYTTGREGWSAPRQDKATEGAKPGESSHASQAGQASQPGQSSHASQASQPGQSSPAGQAGQASPAGQASQVSNGQASQVSNKVRELADGVKHTASDLAGQARTVAESRISGGKDQAIDRLGAVANAVRKTGEHLREAGDGSFTDYFDRAASQVDNAASYLKRKTIPQVMEDVESFARTEPALFLGAAFTAGLLGGRFLKSSKTPPAPAVASSGARAASPSGESKSSGVR